MAWRGKILMSAHSYLRQITSKIAQQSTIYDDAAVERATTECLKHINAFSWIEDFGDSTDDEIRFALSTTLRDYLIRPGGN